MKKYSYWIDTVKINYKISSEIPKNIDVLIVGSGYTGLNTAIEIAKNDRSVCVIDKGQFGEGCSTKNGGQISNLLKPSLDELSKKYGSDKAKKIRGEGVNALEWLINFIKSENIDCDLKRDGRFHGAHTPEAYEKIARNCENLNKTEGIESIPISKANQKNEINSNLYHGGVLFPQHASINPGKYHHELLVKSNKLGVRIISNCEMIDFIKLKNGFDVKTSKGLLRTKDLIIATNGYTSNVTPWHNRRNIPIGSYVIATEELPNEFILDLLPSKRHVTDTCRVVYYYRPSPDGKRIIFGGRVSSKEISLDRSGPLLKKDLVRIFPTLTNVDISYSWMGYVSYSFDHLPHIGCNDGVFYSMGYCGSGIGLSSYLGMKLGRKILQKNDGMTAFDDIDYPTKMFYYGKPWFLPALVEVYKFKDNWEMRKYNKSN